MTRDSGRILETMADAIVSAHAPLDGNLYDISNLVLSSRMLAMAAQDLDQAADNLITENEALRELFQNAQAQVRSTELNRQLSDGIELTASDFKVSSLRQINNRLMSILIDLHAHVEERQDAEALELNRKIWQILQKGAEKNMLPWFS